MRVREKLTQRWRRDDAVGHTIRRARGEEILWPLRAAADVENVAAREDSERSYNERLEMEMEAVEDEVKRKHTGDDSSSMEAVHHESEQRWLLHHRFRTVLLGLLWASSSTTAAMLLVPGILSGCDADSLAVVPILLVPPLRRYTTEGTYLQRVWHWVGFLMVEAQMMATVVAIAFAIDVMWIAQRAQSTAEARVTQIENEKERLMWDTVLKLQSQAGPMDQLEVEVSGRAASSRRSHLCVVHLQGAPCLHAPVISHGSGLPISCICS